MKRVGALAGAVLMIVAALALRGGSDGGNGDDGRPSGGSGVICPTEFADVCAAADDVRTERAGTTADTLTEGDDTSVLERDTWVVPASWARLVIAERARMSLPPLYEIDGDPLASSSVVGLVWQGQDAQLTDACGGISWRCIAGDPAVDFRVRPGLPTVNSALGLSVAAAQAADLLERSDYASNDFGPDFRRLAAVLAEDQIAEPVREMRAKGPGRFSAVGTVTAETASLTASGGTIVPFVSDPAVRVDVVAVVRSGGSLDPRTRTALEQAFADAGWGAPVDGPDGLPSGGVLAAVRTLWNENR